MNHNALDQLGRSLNRASAQSANAITNKVSVSVSGATAYDAVNGHSAESQSVHQAACRDAILRTKSASSTHPASSSAICA